MRIDGLQLLGCQGIAIGIVRAIETILCQIGKVVLLVEFVISTLFLTYSNILLPGFIVDLGMLQHIFKQRECLRHILTQSIEVHGDGTGVDRNIVVAGQLIELLLDLLRCKLVSA